MTKSEFKKIAVTYGVDARYSGKERTMWLHGPNAGGLISLMKNHQAIQFSMKIHKN